MAGAVGFGSLDLLLIGPHLGGYLRGGGLGSRASHLLRGSSRLLVWKVASEMV